MRKKKVQAAADEDAHPFTVAVSHTAVPELVEYLTQPTIATFNFDTQRELFSYEVAPNNRRWVPGLHSYLNRHYLARDYTPAKRASWKRSKAKKPSEHKKGSSRAEGIATMTALETTIFSGGTRPPRINRYASAILDWLQNRGFEIQAVELPVLLPGLNRATKADLVTLTLNKQGFIIWEIKCGWPPGAHRGTHKFNSTLPSIKNEPCNPINMFCMQAMYTKMAAEASGLKNVESARVLHVFEAEVAGDATTPPAPRKTDEMTRSGSGKETWEQEWREPFVDNARGIRFHKVMRVVVYDMPKWCVDHEKEVDVTRG